MRNSENTDLLSRLVEQQGNQIAAAATLGISPATLWRWRNGSRAVPAIALVAVRAVLAHPQDYAEYTKLARPAHRPPAASS